MAVCEKSRLLVQFRGSLVGAVIGDCLGAPFEGDPHVSGEQVLDFFRKIVHGKQFHYTDDTAMTRCVADSLVSEASFNAVDMAKRFVKEFNDQPHRGYGRNVGTVFESLTAENFKDPFGPATKQFGGRGSYGNGGAMRISPAALFTYKENETKVDEMVKNITRITHSNTDAINGTILQCVAIQTALAIEPDAKKLLKSVKTKTGAVSEFTEAFVSKLSERMIETESSSHTKLHQHSTQTASNRQQQHSEPENSFPGSLCCCIVNLEASQHHHNEKSLLPYCCKLDHIKRLLLSQEEFSKSDIQKFLGNDISALGSVPAAIYSFLHCIQPVKDIDTQFSPFERTIIYAVSLGGDTDTIASMAGAIAGAYYGDNDGDNDGDNVVREEWLQVCEGVKDAKDYAESLYNVVVKRLGKSMDNDCKL